MIILLSILLSIAIQLGLFTVNLAMNNSIHSISYSCPAKYADLSYKPISGVLMMIKFHGRYEFVVPPNSTAILAVNYYSRLNNLTKFGLFGDVHLSRVLIKEKRYITSTITEVINHTITKKYNVTVPLCSEGTPYTVKAINYTIINIHNITVYYLIDTNNMEEGVYAIPFPSTCVFQAILVVGDKPYYGPLPCEGEMFS